MVGASGAGDVDTAVVLLFFYNKVSMSMPWYWFSNATSQAGMASSVPDKKHGIRRYIHEELTPRC